MTEYELQALDFLKKANATCRIEFGGRTWNPNWKEEKQRNFYHVSLSTPRGNMTFTFWDSIYNTNISKLDVEKYALTRFGRGYQYLTKYEQKVVKKELKKKKAKAVPTAYDVLACLEKCDVGTFKYFCREYGYDDDSIAAYKTYVLAVEEYDSLKRIFTPEQMEELREIQ